MKVKGVLIESSITDKAEQIDRHSIANSWTNLNAFNVECKSKIIKNVQLIVNDISYL